MSSLRDSNVQAWIPILPAVTPPAFDFTGVELRQRQAADLEHPPMPWPEVPAPASPRRFDAEEIGVTTTSDPAGW